MIGKDPTAVPGVQFQERSTFFILVVVWGGGLTSVALVCGSFVSATAMGGHGQGTFYFDFDFCSVSLLSPCGCKFFQVNYTY